jgi:DNA-binding phage protein
MDHDAVDLISRLGPTVRRAVRAAGMTLSGVSRSTQLSTNCVEKFVVGSNNPRMITAIKLLDLLGKSFQLLRSGFSVTPEQASSEVGIDPGIIALIEAGHCIDPTPIDAYVRWLEQLAVKAQIQANRAKVAQRTAARAAAAAAP